MRQAVVIMLKFSEDKKFMQPGPAKHLCNSNKVPTLRQLIVKTCPQNVPVLKLH